MTLEPNALYAARVDEHKTAFESEPIERFRLQAGRTVLECISLGAAITRLDVADRSGQLTNVVLDHANLERYAQGREYFGAVVGRLANRLRDAQLPLDGALHWLTTNDGVHHLHGGVTGFDKRLWRPRDVGVDQGRACATFEYVSPDGEQGYPGELHARVRYAVADDGTVEIALSAISDRATVVNLTNHSYFNLAGHGTVLDHKLQVDAERFCVVDAELLPTGELRSVAGTPFDFRSAKRIGQDLAADDPQLRLAGGYDHCLVLTPPEAAPTVAVTGAAELRRACVLTEPASGRSLEVWTDQPGVQLYSGNFLDGRCLSSDGRRFDRHAGLCLETQRLPDAPHHPAFPSVVLRPGETYRSTTLWRFQA
jgi:aldose 1-epimerase